MSASDPIWQDEERLLDHLTRPRPVLVEFISRVESPLVVLGAGGKMGPTLCVLARRAAHMAGHELEVIAVSRFSSADTRQWLETQGVATLSLDLMEQESMSALPEARQVINMMGLKFGTQQNPARTWAANTLAPAYVAQRYAQSRLVALSTGNVYPLVPVAEGGAREDHPLTPLGEYANAAVARERIYEYFSVRNQTPMAVIRLNYAVELRYGVMVDIARRVWEGQPVDVSNGWLNCIWQGDANEMILRCLDLTQVPARSWNLTGPETLSVRQLALEFGRHLDREVSLTGHEAGSALLNNAGRLCGQLGNPPTEVSTMVGWISRWIQRGGPLWDKPTRFEIRDGRY